MRCRTRLRPRILAGEARTTGRVRELGYREAPLAGSLGVAAGSPPRSIGGALRQIKNDRGVARQDSPGPEKLDGGGVVRGAGSGRSVAPGPAAPRLESYSLARSRRRRRVNGSAFSAIPRTRWARPR